MSVILCSTIVLKNEKKWLDKREGWLEMIVELKRNFYV